MTDIHFRHYQTFALVRLIVQMHVNPSHEKQKKQASGKDRS
jgi:hypothetical protein